MKWKATRFDTDSTTVNQRIAKAHPAQYQNTTACDSTQDPAISSPTARPAFKLRCILCIPWFTTWSTTEYTEYTEGQEQDVASTVRLLCLQSLDSGGDEFDCDVDFFGIVEAAEAEAQALSGLLVAASDGS